jgi:hypothetical protein
MKAHRFFSILWLIGGALTGVAQEERLSLGDERFAVEVATPLTGWIETRGPRFDTTAAIVSVRVDGKEFLTEGGLADEFNPKWISPPGFDQAKPGEPFLKIGVGVLLRKSEWRYFFGHRYAVKQLAEVEHMAGLPEGVIGFRQRCDSQLGWGYDYEKNYAVDAATRTLVIRYRMENTGEKPFTIEQYTHNWFAFAAPKEAGVSHTLHTPFVLDEGLSVPGPLPDPIYRMAEQTTSAAANRVRLQNASDGRWVEFTGDFAVSRFALAVDANTFSAEVFGRWALPPGATVTWSRTYRFGFATADDS